VVYCEFSKMLSKAASSLFLLFFGVFEISRVVRRRFGLLDEVET